MEDIVEAALEEANNATACPNDPATDEFGSPRPVFIGCGDEGVRTVAEGWERRNTLFDHTEAPTVAIASGDRLVDPRTEYQISPTDVDSFDSSIPAPVSDAEYAIITVTLERSDDCLFAIDVTEALPEPLTTVAIPAIPTADTLSSECEAAFSELVDATDTTIPIAMERLPETIPTYFDRSRQPATEAVRNLSRTLIRELATDLVTMLSARVPLSAPAHELWEALETAGLTAGFRGWIHGFDSDDAIADRSRTLLSHAIERPLSTDIVESEGDSLGFLLGSQDLTLAEAETVREQLGSQLDQQSSERPLFTAETITLTVPSWRLTGFVTGVGYEQFHEEVIYN